jgi:hypothetical protein
LDLVVFFAAAVMVVFDPEELREESVSAATPGAARAVTNNPAKRNRFNMV